jgi:PAS domain-containing protein
MRKAATELPEPFRFLSLKWKAFLLVGLLGSVAAGGFTLVSYRSLWDHLLLQEQRRHEEEVGDVQSLMARWFLGCDRAAATISSLDGMEQALVGASPKDMAHRFDVHWAKVRSTFDLDSAALFDSEGRPTAAWGADGLRSPAPSELPSWTRNALSRNESAHRVWCNDRECGAESAVPLMAHGRTVGTVILGASFKEVVLAAGLPFPSDAALVLLSSGSATPPLSADHIPEWKARVLPFTKEARARQILRAAAASHPEGIGRATGIGVESGRHHYRVGFVPLPTASGGGTSAFFVTVTDVTQWVSRARRSVAETLFLGGAAVSIASVLTLGFLWTPMRRLTRAASALRDHPPARRYGEARQALAEALKQRGVQDEIDVLARCGMELVNSIEAGEQDVNLMMEQWRQERGAAALRATELEQRSRDLVALTKQMEEERDATVRLLDAAPFAVVVHTLDGGIEIANRFAHELAGLADPELYSEGFGAIMGLPESPEEIGARMAEVLRGERGELRHNATKTSAGGSTRRIEWNHRRLERPNDEGGTDALLVSFGFELGEREKEEGHPD